MSSSASKASRSASRCSPAIPAVLQGGSLLKISSELIVQQWYARIDLDLERRETCLAGAIAQLELKRIKKKARAG